MLRDLMVDALERLHVCMAGVAPRCNSPVM